MAIFDSIRAAELQPATDNLELYRRAVTVTPAGAAEAVQLSVLDVAPERFQRTVVLIHGFAGSSAWWYPQIPSLARQHRVVAIEMRGHGRSSRPRNGYAISQMVDDIAVALRELGVSGPVVMVGHSVGGFVVTDFALRYPDQVSRLVLIATPVTVRPRSLPLYARISMACPDFLLRVAQPLYEMDPKGRGTAYLLGIKRLYQDDLAQWNGEDKFPHLSQPTLVIAGDRDYAFPERYYTRVAELIPQAEWVSVGVSKHQVPLERPRAVLRAVERFLRPDTQAGFEPLWRSENDDVDSVRLLAERPWVARYGASVPPDLDVPHVPLTRLLQNAAQSFPQRAAIRYRGRAMSYRALYDKASRFAAALRRLGIAPGERVMMMLPNLPQFVIGYYGALQMGAALVLSHPEETTERLIQQARRTGARILVTLGGLGRTAAAIADESEVQHIIYVGGDVDLSAGPCRSHRWSQLLVADPMETPVAAVDARDVAVILFTAGMTGPSRSIPLTHRNLVANALQVGAWLSGVRSGRGGILCATPFSHGYGMGLGINLAVYLGMDIQLPSAWDLGALLEGIKGGRPALFVASPATYIALNTWPDLRSYMPRHAPLFISGIEALPVEVKESFERLTKAQLIEGYGVSEAGGMTHLSPVVEPRTGSVGLPLPGTEARIVDWATGRPRSCGGVGELWVRGPQVMPAWEGDGVAGPAVLDEEGWLHTGDVARMDDDGYFYVLGCRRDVWASDDGALLFSRDVEEVIYELPEVREAAVAVVAEDDGPRWVAFVSPRAGERVSGEAIRAFCRGRLPASHTPRRIVLVDELPRDRMGRVAREALRLLDEGTEG